MDMQNVAREIGPLETAINLAQVSGSNDVIRKVGMSMPMPDSDIKQRVVNMAKWLLGYEKQKYMFLSPEIALIEEMAKQCHKSYE